MLITRYLLKNLLYATLFVAVVLTGVIWLTQSLRFLELIVNTAAPMNEFLKVVALSLPSFMEVVLPISLLSAVLFTYNKLTTDNELIVMRASGMSQWMLARPAVLLAVLVTALLLLLSTWLSPAAHSKMQHLRQVVKAEYSALLLREGVFNTVGDDLTVYLRNRDSEGTLYGIMIHDTRVKDAPPVTVTAKKGKMVMTEDGPSVVVFEGRRQQVDEKTGNLSNLDFEQYTLEIEYQKEVRIRWKEPDERTFIELLNPDMTNKFDRRYRAEFTVEAVKRLVTPFYALAFTMMALACLLVGPFNRRGQTKRIVTAIVLSVILQGAALGLSNVAKQHVAAIFAIGALVVLAISCSTFLLTARGETFRLNLSRRMRGHDDDVAEEVA